MANLIPDKFWEEFEAAGFFMDMRPDRPWTFGLKPPHAMPWEDPDDPFRGFYRYDNRAYWEKMDPAGGVPVWEALYHFIDKQKAAQLFVLALAGYGDESNRDPLWWPEENREFDFYSFRLQRLLSDLKGQLLRKLFIGELVAHGFSSQASLDEPLRRIVPERWGDMELDVQNSRASGPGFEVTQIRIFPCPRDQESESVGKLARRPRVQFSAARLRRWYQARIKECQQAGQIPSRDDDYRDANAAFGSVPRKQVRKLRQELAPGLWTRKGRRRSPQS